MLDTISFFWRIPMDPPQFWPVPNVIWFVITYPIIPYFPVIYFHYITLMISLYRSSFRPPHYITIWISPVKYLQHIPIVISPLECLWFHCFWVWNPLLYLHYFTQYNTNIIATIYQLYCFWSICVFCMCILSGHLAWLWNIATFNRQSSIHGTFSIANC
jgi:hypothetical protein